MSVVVTAPVGPRVHRWTKAEYHQMHELGWFIDQRVELIDGEILDMPPAGNPHDIAIEAVSQALRAVFATGHWVRAQMGLDLSPTSEPEPDVAVVVGDFRTFTARPSTALLVVEVSDSSLSYDRNAKASLYASAGILDYWIVDLNGRRLEIRRNPVPDAAQPFDHAYADLTALGPGDAVSPLAAPGATVAVADLLP